MATTNNKTHFAPELHIPNGTINIDFYMKFGATENFCLRNDDGSIHVAELEISGAIFHVHETMRGDLEPISAKGVTSVIGLFVPNVQEVMYKAIQAGN
jgi:PhnB protein